MSQISNLTVVLDSGRCTDWVKKAAPMVDSRMLSKVFLTNLWTIDDFPTALSPKRTSLNWANLSAASDMVNGSVGVGACMYQQGAMITSKRGFT